ncbi:hypothetical protein ACHAWF_000403, partial [Thalassiosira exigua]
HEHLMANKIAENLYAQVDDEGREILRFADIVDHHKDSTALTEENGFIKVQGGGSKCIKTTKGWEILVEWKDGTSLWLSFRDVKEGSPVELAEYAVAMGLDKRARLRMYGIRVQKTLEEALRIDKEMVTDFWEKTMIKKMTKAKVPCELVDGCTPEEVRLNGVPALRGHQEISCHIIFDVKMDFTRKARFVANGSTTDTPIALTYSSVVSQDSVRIALLVAALNDLDIFACDIGKKYLNAPCKERIWFVAGHEYGHKMKGRVMKLICALYVLKSSRASWRKMFKDFIVTHLEFTLSRID